MYEVPHVNHVEYQLSDISEDAFVSSPALQTELYRSAWH